MSLASTSIDDKHPGLLRNSRRFTVMCSKKISERPFRQRPQALNSAKNNGMRLNSGTEWGIERNRRQKREKEREKNRNGQSARVE